VYHKINQELFILKKVIKKKIRSICLYISKPLSTFPLLGLKEKEREEGEEKSYTVRNSRS